MAWPMPFVPPVTRTRWSRTRSDRPRSVAQSLDNLQTGNLPLVEGEDEAELDGATWEVPRNTACDSCVCGHLGDVDDCDGAGVLRVRLLHPFANGQEAAPLLTLILDGGTLGEVAEHGVDIMIIVPGEIRRQWFR